MVWDMWYDGARRGEGGGVVVLLCEIGTTRGGERAVEGGGMK